MAGQAARDSRRALLPRLLELPLDRRAEPLDRLLQLAEHARLHEPDIDERLEVADRYDVERVGVSVATISRCTSSSRCSFRCLEAGARGNPGVTRDSDSPHERHLRRVLRTQVHAPQTRSGAVTARKFRAGLGPPPPSRTTEIICRFGVNALSSKPSNAIRLAALGRLIEGPGRPNKQRFAIPAMAQGVQPRLLTASSGTRPLRVVRGAS